MKTYFKEYKRILSVVLSVLILNTSYYAVAQTENKDPALNTADSKLEKNEQIVPSSVYTGEVQMSSTIDDKFTGEVKSVKQGAKIDLTVSTVLGSDVSMEGDQFFAEVTNDVAVDGGIVIPMGTVAHGCVTETQEQKRLGRDGFVKIKFDYLVTPDGREIPIQAELSTKSHPLKSFAKVALTDMGYTLAGGALGGLFALNYGGLALAAATHGYSIAGGAAIGGTIGAAQSLARKGKPLLISPGDQIKLKVNSNLELPVIKPKALLEEEKFLDGLTVNIYECKFEKDPFGENNTITLGLDIVNRTKRNFTFMDIALINESGRVFYPTPFGDTSIWFHKLDPSTKIQGYLSFSVDNPHQKHYIVFFDKYSRTQLAKISVNNAIRNLNEAKKKSKKAN